MGAARFRAREYTTKNLLASYNDEIRKGTKKNITAKALLRNSRRQFYVTTTTLKMLTVTLNLD